MPSATITTRSKSESPREIRTREDLEQWMKANGVKLPAMKQSQPKIISQNHWSVIIIKKQSHSLRHYFQCQSRVEARNEVKRWKELNHGIVSAHHIYIGRTNGF